MSDQAKCRGDAPCPVRESCARYVRPESDRQTFLIVPAFEQHAQCSVRVEVQPEPIGRWVDGRWVVSKDWVEGAK